MEYLDKKGIKTFLDQLKKQFGLKSVVDTARSALDNYILNMNYSPLEFDTDFIIGEATTSSAVVGEAMVGSAIVGNS